MAIVRVTDRSHLYGEVLAGYLFGASWLCAVLSISVVSRST